MTLLEKMVDDFEENVDLPESEDQLLSWPKVLNSQSLDPDGLWEVMARAMEAVPFGEDLLDEFIAFALQTPLSKQFLPKVLLVWADRCK